MEKKNISKIKRKLGHHIWLSRLMILVAAVLVLGLLFWMLSAPIWGFLTQIWRGPKAITTFFSDPLYTLPSYEARTNVLLIGMGGEEHDGGKLTDTIIFMALDLKHDQISMLSIPRDIWVPSLGTKINAAYAIGAQESTASGYTILEDAVYEIVDQPIHYIVGVDFDGFEELVDALGGVSVHVDRGFVDERYPIRGKGMDDCGGDPEFGCRYETLSFEPGDQIMDGKTALKFARSRYAQGEEGTDYARSLRQQKVILAVKDAISDGNVLLNPSKLLELKGIFDRYIVVDPELGDDEYAGFASFALAFWRSGNEIKTITLDQGSEEVPGFLVNPPIQVYDAWVLEPRGASWDQFQAYFRQVLNAE